MNKKGYQNIKTDVLIRDSDTIQTFRFKVADKMKIPYDSFLITQVHDQKIQKIISFNAQMSTFDSNTLILYQIKQELNPSLLPVEMVNKFDNNHNIAHGWVKMVVNFSQYN